MVALTAVQLREENARLRIENEQLQRRILSLVADVARLKRQLFGPKAERIRNAESQGSLLDILAELELLSAGDNDAGDRAEVLVAELEDELEGDGEPPPPALPAPSKQKRKKKSAPHGRRKLDEIEMPTERVVLEPHERSAEGGEALVRIGEEITHIVDHRPASLVRIEVVRPKYKLPVATQRDDTDDVAARATIVIADPPALPIPKSMAGAGLLAHVLVQKYGDHRVPRRQGRGVA